VKDPFSQFLSGLDNFGEVFDFFCVFVKKTCLWQLSFERERGVTGEAVRVRAGFGLVTCWILVVNLDLYFSCVCLVKYCCGHLSPPSSAHPSDAADACDPGIEPYLPTLICNNFICSLSTRSFVDGCKPGKNN